MKLLDFGIAKLLDPDDAGEATDHGLRILTPAYAAPEQLDGRPVTTATDVYVLGAVLSELLTGVRPVPHPPDHRGRLPSVAARELGQEAEPVARARRTTRSRLARRLAGDIDRIRTFKRSSSRSSAPSTATCRSTRAASTCSSTRFASNARPSRRDPSARRRRDTSSASCS